MKKINDFGLILLVIYITITILTLLNGDYLIIIPFMPSLIELFVGYTSDSRHEYLFLNLIFICALIIQAIIIYWSGVLIQKYRLLEKITNPGLVLLILYLGFTILCVIAGDLGLYFPVWPFGFFLFEYFFDWGSDEFGFWIVYTLIVAINSIAVYSFGYWASRSITKN